MICNNSACNGTKIILIITHRGQVGSNWVKFYEMKYLPKKSSGISESVTPRTIPSTVIADKACSIRRKSSSIIPRIRKTL